MQHSAKLVARVKLTLTKRTVDALEPEDKPWIAWDDKLTGFGVRVHPSGAKAYLVNYRSGTGGRKAPNKRVVVGRAGRVTPDQARRLAQELLGRVAAGDDPASERAEARGVPTLGEACKDYMDSGHGRAASTERGYRRYTDLYLGDWLTRPLDNITRREVESRFQFLTERHGEMPANQCLSFLRSVYRRPCVDYEGLRNPVEQWLAAGGRYHRKKRKRISSPAEVLPCWRRGLEAEVSNGVHRDVFLFGLYTGMRLGEVVALRWEDVELDAGLFRVEETKTGVPLELPVTRQLGEILARRRAEGGSVVEEPGEWVFPSPMSGSGHVEELDRYYGAIGRSEVLVSRFAELLHHGGGAGADAAAVIDQASGEPCPAGRRDRGLCRGLDGGTTKRARATGGGPHRCVDGPRGADGAHPPGC